MFFNTTTFLIFFAVVWAIYWACLSERRDLRNAFLVLASYVFYGWWDWRFLSLIILSSIIDFLVGAAIGKLDSGNSSEANRRKLLMGLSLFSNLGILFLFKYYNFFIDSLGLIFPYLANGPGSWVLENVILPVGISFYTFQTLSYTIDVYRKKLEPTNNVLAFFAYVAFFPQLVAGPIERAGRLLPQFMKKTVAFDATAATDGLRMILWGLFLKAVVADNLSFHVDLIFGTYERQPASVLALGAIYFGFQIYGDFAGYSLIARGLARLLGFELMNNFRFPYFARDIAEFWRRWHISLSTWFRDYVYIPLGGSRKGAMRTVLNVLIVFVVSGLWHGAKWTFLTWGLIHALLFLPLILLNKNRSNLDETAKGRWLPSLREFAGMAATFSLVTFAWIFFRAENIGQASGYVRRLFDPSLFSIPAVGRSGVIWVAVLVGLDWLHRLEDVPIRWNLVNSSVRWTGYVLLVCTIYFRGYFGQQSFIYFQF